jgi:thiazole/oxazole-forming peptide maturase SagD family component
MKASSTIVWPLSSDALCATTNFGQTIVLHRLNQRGSDSPELPGIKQATSTVCVDGHEVVASTFLDPVAWIKLLRTQGQCPAGVFYHRGMIVVAPPVHVGGQLCPWCIALRLAAAAPDPSAYRPLLLGNDVVASHDGMNPVEMHRDLTAGALAARRGLQHPDTTLSAIRITDEDRRVSHHVLRAVPGVHGKHSLKDEYLVDMPTWRSSYVPTQDAKQEDLVDSVVGPITSLLGKSEPRCPDFVTFIAATGHLGQFVKWKPDDTGSGTAPAPRAAIDAAIGEAVERYSGNYVPISRLVEASENALRGKADRVLSPRTFGAAYYADHRPNEFRRYDPQNAEYWIQGVNLGDDSLVWVPAEAAVLSFTRRSGRRPLFPVQLTGIAAGASRAHALESAALEAIERDTVMRWWFGTTACYVIGEPSAPRSATALGAIRTWSLYLDNDYGVPVVAGCLEDLDSGIITTGYAARHDLGTAMSKASSEAFQSLALSLQMLDPDSPIRSAIKSGKLDWPVLPFEAERTYSRYFQADYADMNQLLHNVQFYLDRTKQSIVRERICEHNLPQKSFDDIERSLPKSHGSAISALRDGGIQHIIEVDLTTDDVKDTHYVTRLLVPELVGMVATAHTPVWHPRLAELPELTIAPLPHS